jgi:multisubunit Na+/H+ antiporter MnhB subunit
MDLSKLPRLSKTDTQAPLAESAADPPAAQPGPLPVVDYRYPGARAGATGRGLEAWISIGVGLIFLFVFPHFTQWWVHSVFHTSSVPTFLPITDSNTGAQIPYSKSVFFFNDLAIASFAYALIIEGIALVLAGRSRPGVVLFALAVTAAAVVLNAYYLISSYATEGFALVSAVAVVFGGYMLWFQWNLARELLAARRAERALADARAAGGA